MIGFFAFYWLLTPILYVSIHPTLPSTGPQLMTFCSIVMRGIANFSRTLSLQTKGRLGLDNERTGYLLSTLSTTLDESIMYLLSLRLMLP